jgi:aldehyde:ferredoxin oxidoreductase
MVFKSPLTNTIAYANTGGYAGAALKLAGFDGIVFVGESINPKIAIVRKSQVEIEDAGQLWGLNSHECMMSIREKFCVQYLYFISLIYL